MNKVYMDYAASTPVDKEVLDEMLPFFDKYYGNASSIHSFGVDAFNAVEEARECVAKIIGAKNDEILFTAGGTESDNIAIKGAAFKNRDKKGSKGYNIITCLIEHPAVLETCKYLDNIGYKVKFLPVDKYGIVNLDELEKSISKDTFLITVMFANNEIGTIEPMQEIGKIAKKT
jgi:cysteine desulfurase